MQFKKILLAAAAAAALTGGAAMAAPAHHQRPAHPVQIADGRGDRDHGRSDRAHNRYDRHNDRGDRNGWERYDQRRYISNDRIYRELRSRNYRYVSAPYFYRGHYVVKAYDRRGRLVFVRVNPYTGSYLGISFRL